MSLWRLRNLRSTYTLLQVYRARLCHGVEVAPLISKEKWLQHTPFVFRRLLRVLHDNTNLLDISDDCRLPSGDGCIVIEIHR